MELKIELIPKTAWGSNLRTRLKKSDWDKLRVSVYEHEEYTCRICGIKRQTLEAHEIWEFDKKTHIQKLVDIVGICKSCHEVIHFGRSQKLGFGNQAIEHFCFVTQLDGQDFMDMMMEAKEKYDRLSKIKDWKLDVSFIENYGFVVDKEK